MQPLAGLMKSAERPSKGPSPSFTRAHVILGFITIGESGIIGRQALAARAGLNEGPARTVIKRLREDGFIDANASGCYLTRAGRVVFDELQKKVSALTDLGGSKLTVGAFQVGLAVRGGGKSVRSGLEQRDSAIKIGAAGATTYVIREAKFAIPGGSPDCESDYPNRAWGRLRESLQPRNGDAVVLCGADEETTAQLGAIAAALTII